jgi:hypothetical protein
MIVLCSVCESELTQLTVEISPKAPTFCWLIVNIDIPNNICSNDQ